MRNLVKDVSGRSSLRVGGFTSEAMPGNVIPPCEFLIATFFWAWPLLFLPALTARSSFKVVS